MVLIVHLDKSILFLDYKNILISITSLLQKISMKRKNSTEQFLFIMADDFCASLVHSSKTSTNKQKKKKKKKKKKKGDLFWLQELRIRKHRKPYSTFCDLLCLIIKNIIMNVYYLNYFFFLGN